MIEREHHYLVVITEIQILEGKCDNIERLVDEHC